MRWCDDLVMQLRACAVTARFDSSDVSAFRQQALVHRLDHAR